VYGSMLGPCRVSILIGAMSVGANLREANSILSYRFIYASGAGGILLLWGSSARPAPPPLDAQISVCSPSWGLVPS